MCLLRWSFDDFIKLALFAEINGEIKDISNIAQWEPEDKDIVEVINGRVRALRAGSTKIRVTYDNFIDIVEVTVDSSKNEPIVHQKTVRRK